MNNIFDFLWQVSEKLVELGTWSYNFLFSRIDLGIVVIDVWAFLGGVGLTFWLITRLIRG